MVQDYPNVTPFGNAAARQEKNAVTIPSHCRN
jgi:hypothetical protein